MKRKDAIQVAQDQQFLNTFTNTKLPSQIQTYNYIVHFYKYKQIIFRKSVFVCEEKTLVVSHTSQFTIVIIKKVQKPVSDGFSPQQQRFR